MEDKEYVYYLPDNAEHRTKSHSLIIIGANGSGKSRLGAWMEKEYPNEIHRIVAQKSLTFQEDIPLKNYESSLNFIYYGDGIRTTHQYNHHGRFGHNPEYYTTKFISDYENVLSAFIALQSIKMQEFIDDCKNNEKNKQEHPKVPEMPFDKLKIIWKSIFPHRDIDIIDGRVKAFFNSDKYSGSYMSDGERAVLYLISQVLIVPKNKIIVIDEPELHLHRSIMEKLWQNIEKEREDCFFIYITHDTYFASSHKNSDKIWIKDFDGNKWKFEKISDNEMPEQLLFDILGNRKAVLFVEGTNDSYDAKLYSEIYNDYYVVPCGSCDSVIMQTKAMKSNDQLHHLNCYGLIDRDFRSEYEINKLKEDGIYTLDVAEVENLFIVEELLVVISNIILKEDAIENIKNYIINERFLNQKESQINKMVISKLKYELGIIDISGKSNDDIKNKLKENINDNIIDEIYSAVKDIFNKNSQDYKAILKIFNEKNLIISIGHYFGLENKEYPKFIIQQLSGEKREQIINAIIEYIPSNIPRNNNVESK